jgi:hypothetical protein
MKVMGGHIVRQQQSMGFEHEHGETFGTRAVAFANAHGKQN